MSSVAPDPAPAGPMRWLRPVLTLVSLAFVGWAAWDLHRRWQGSHVSFAFGPALLSALPLLLGIVLQALCWLRLIDRMSGRRVPRKPAVALYFESQIARYMPGKVGLPLVRMAGASRLGVPASTVGSSVLVEAMSWVAVGSTVGFGLVTATSRYASGVTALLGRAGPALLALSALGVVGLLVIDRRRFPGPLLRALRLGGTGPLVPVAVPLYHLAFWLTWALHGVLLSAALGAGTEVAFSTAGLFTLAPIAGFVAFAAPAGIGVREALLSIGLAPTLGPAAAIAAAVLSRAGSLVTDVLAYAMTRAWWRQPAGK